MGITFLAYARGEDEGVWGRVSSNRYTTRRIDERKFCSV